MTKGRCYHNILIQWAQRTDEGPDEPMQYEDESEHHIGHQQHAEVFPQETVGEAPPSLAHRNPFGPPHTGDEASQVEAEMDLAVATAKEVGDSDIEEEVAEANPVSTGAAKIIQEAKQTAEKAEDMAVTLGGGGGH